MRQGGGGAKGGAYERDICKALSKAMTQGEREDLFWRTAMSGGRATMMNRRGNQNLSQTGDITAIDPTGQWLMDAFIVECKFHADIQLQHFLLNGKGKIADWLATAIGQALPFGKEALLVVKENRIPTLVVTTAKQISHGGWFAPLRPRMTLDDGIKVLSFNSFVDDLKWVCDKVAEPVGGIVRKKAK